MLEKREKKEKIKYTITKPIGVIGETPSGWHKELNFVSWNDRAPKLDIRDWNETHDKMGRGITLFKSEAIAMLDLLSSEVVGEIAEQQIYAEEI